MNTGPSDSARIVSIGTRRLRIPLIRPWGPDVRDLGVISVRIECSDGSHGRGFSWTPTIGAGAVESMLREEIGPWAVGRSVDLAGWREGGWTALWAHLHEAGGGGVTTIAMAGLDLALWDRAGRSQGRSLVDVLGRRRTELEAYGSGVNLHYGLDELVAQARRWVDAGFGAVKIKVGKPDLAEDDERVAAVREVIGPRRSLMLDANQRWDLDRATEAMEVLAVHEPAWIEEPLRAEDLRGHVELRRRIDVPIALGENVHHLHRFAELIDAGACDVVQPNVVRVGGITPFLTIADRVTTAGLTLMPHLLPELSTQLGVCLAEPTWVEDVEGARFDDLGALATPSGLAVEAGRATHTGGPGIGLEFGDLRDGAPTVEPH